MRTIIAMGTTILVASFMLFQINLKPSDNHFKIKSYQTEEIQANNTSKKRQLATSNEYYVKACTNQGLDPKGGLFSSKDEDKYKKNRNKLIKGDDSVFKSFVIEDDSGKAVNTAISSFGLPIVLMIIFIVFSYPIGYLCYYCCACMPDKWCPPCKCCCKKCLCIQCSREEPYAGFSKLWPIVGMFVFLGWMMIAAIIGLAYTSGIEDSFKKFRCSTINFLYTVNAGATGWGGVDNMHTVMTQLRSDLTVLQANISNTLAGCPSGGLCIDTERGTVNTEKTGLTLNLASTTIFKDKYNRDVSPSAIFYTNGSYKLNPHQAQSTTYSQSAFFGKGSGSSSLYDQQASAVVSAGDTILDSIQSTLASISSAGNAITGASFSTAINDGIKAIEDQQKFMNDEMKSLYDTTDDPAQYMSLLTTILNAIFGAFLGLSILVAVLGALMVAFNWYKVRLVLHLCWALFTLVTTISMLIALVLFIISIIGFGSCDYIGYDILSWDDPENTTRSPEWEKLNEKVFKLSGDSKEIAEACFKSLGGNGDIFGPLGIKSQLSDLNTINNFATQRAGFDETMNAVSSQITTFKQVFVDLFKNSQISSGSNTVNEHPSLAGAISDANTAFAAFDERFTQLHNSSVTLTSGNVVYIPFPNVASTTTIFWIGDNWREDGGSTAGTVEANDYYVNAADTGTNDKRIKQYAAGSPTGSAPFDTLWSTHINPILAWRDHKDAIAMNRLKEVLEYETAFAAIKTKINTAFNTINTTLQKIDDSIATITHPKTGLLGTDNKCFFIGNGIDDTLKSMCWGFFPSLYLIAESLIFIAVGMGMSSFFLCCTAMRYSKNLQLLNKKTGPAQAKTGGG